MNQNEIIEQYKEMHKSVIFSKGTALLKHVPELGKLVNLFECKTILDYGCGKAWFWKLKHWPAIFNNIPQSVCLYDPAIPEFAYDPPDTRFDMVVCTDVMEHVHPDHTVEVLDKLMQYTRKVLFLNISTVPAKKTFEDGTNLHINIRTKDEWNKLIGERRSEYGTKYKAFPAVVVRYDDEVYT